jgi:hypothetical protein
MTFNVYRRHVQSMLIFCLIASTSATSRAKEAVEPATAFKVEIRGAETESSKGGKAFFPKPPLDEYDVPDEATKRNDVESLRKEISRLHGLLDRQKREARPRRTVLGTAFDVQPEFDDVIDQAVARVRETVREERSNGKIICYISIPLSARGGGHRPTNVAISNWLKERLEEKYGSEGFWALAPGQVENELPNVGELRPTGGDYLFMWTAILAGDDGQGSDFDMVYFAGPRDFHEFFGITGNGAIPQLQQYIDERAEDDEEFRTAIATNPTARSVFLRYYAVRASASFSAGAHDEWNIFRLVNQRRDISEQAAVFFDGQAVPMGAMDAEARLGYQIVE